MEPCLLPRCAGRLTPCSRQRLADCLIECYERSVREGCPMKLREFVSGRSRLENPAALRLAEFFKVNKLYGHRARLRPG